MIDYMDHINTHRESYQRYAEKHGLEFLKNMLKSKAEERNKLFSNLEFKLMMLNVEEEVLITRIEKLEHEEKRNETSI